MNLLARLDPGDAVISLMFVVALQTSIVILLAAFLSGTWLRRRAEGRHALWLGVLGVIVASPATAAAVRESGFVLWVIALPRTNDGARSALEEQMPRHRELPRIRRCPWRNRSPFLSHPRPSALARRDCRFRTAARS